MNTLPYELIENITKYITNTNDYSNLRQVSQYLYCVLSTVKRFDEQGNIIYSIPFKHHKVHGIVKYTYLNFLWCTWGRV